MSSQPVQPVRSDIDDLGVSTAAPSVSDIETEIITPAVENNPQFYFNDGMLKFLVEDQLFHIHAAFLTRESDMLKQVKDFPRDKVHDAVVLRGVTAFEFECLVDFFYNGMFNDYKPTWEAIVALLATSSRFAMSRVRDFAIKAADSMKDQQDAITLIVIAKTYEIQDWLAPAYAELCQRSSALSAAEGKRLGWETFALLAEARENFIKDNPKNTVSAQVNDYKSFNACSPYEGGTAPPYSWYDREVGEGEGSHSYYKTTTTKREMSQDKKEDKSQERALSIVKEIFWPSPPEK